ncbi:hypothetical protein GCM10023237_09080 [Streptomyces coeruleoprunus]|uniref:tetratricopeptide repeat protein n=1 Tax=Streptomyces coeruleoprunus TaxID=285563 RepID=UPI0031E6FCEB
MDTAAEHGSAIMLESISGMAGVGKTALAVRAAHECADRFPDGQLYLDLRAHAQGQEPLTAGAALATLLRLLDVPPQSIPTDVEERAALWRRALARRRVLVVLDDAAEPAQVRPLLPGGTESFAIVTSRRRLVGLPQSRSLALDVLPAEDAVRLFREVAGLGPRGDGEERAEIERIVRLCGHLPLAIEIAANRLSAHPSWTPAVLRERLTRTTGRLGEIRDGYSEVARAFEMSYQTLSPDERTTFRLLSLHVGPEFGPRAAAALRGRPVAETERALESLFHCHLLQEPSPNRFRFHDLLGEYARLLCAATETPEQRDAALDRLIDHYLHEADRCDRTLYPRRLRLAVPAGTGTAPVRDLPDRPDRPDLPVLRDEEALAWFRTERSNLVDAARHERLRGRHEGAARLSHVLAEFLNSECHWVDALRLHDAAVDHWTGAGDTDALCRALLDLSRACAATGNYARAEDSARRSLRLAERTGCADVEAEALRELGVLHWHMGRNQQALVFHERSLALCARTEDPWRRARCENNIAISLLYLGRHDEALRAFRSAINGFRTAGDQRMLGKTLNNLGNLYMHMGRPAQARRTLESGLRIAELAGSRLDLVALQINLAETLATSGNPRKAIDVYRRALPVLQELGDRKTEAIALTGIGTAHRAMGRTDQAATHFQQALALSSSIGAVLEETRARRLLGAAEFARGNVVAAVEHITAAIASARHIEAPDEEAKAEESLAEVRMSAGDVAGARALWRHAHGLLQPLDAGAAERIQNRLIEVDHLPQ